MKKKASLFVVFVLTIFALGCAKEEPEISYKINVVASIYPVYEFAKAVAGESADVQLLLPAGAEAHDWEPAAGDIKKINSASIFLYNGGGMEPWANKLSEAAQDKKKVFVETGEGLFTLERTSGHTDPHIWLDPVFAQAQVAKIRDVLIKENPKEKEIYEKNADKYIAELKKLDDDYKKLAQESKGKAFITMHAAFGYLASNYGWEQIPLIGTSPHAEPNPAQIAKIMQITQEKEIKYIFVEPNTSDKIMKEIAIETNTQLLPLDTLEAPNDKGSSYIVRMRENLANLAKAFMVQT